MDHLKITITGKKGDPAMVYIFDKTGRMVYSEDKYRAGEEITLTKKIPKGSYILQILSGKEVNTKTLIHIK